MVKKLLVFWMALLCLGCFSGCGNGKIDIGGKNKGEMLPKMAVRIMLDKDIFNINDEITVKLGFGFTGKQATQSLMESGAVLILKIEAANFIIIDESEVESDNEYEKEFAEYSDDKFVCTLNKKRYVPNYYELFVIQPTSDKQDDSGTIIISAVLFKSVNSFDGKIERLYYASNSDKIAFSAISVANAQKKLK